ncbi:trichodiene synthase [Sarocladium strictum]
MADRQFPTESYIQALTRFLDIVNYNDTNFTPEERIRTLHYAYTKAAAHFAQPFQQKHIKASPKRLQASLQTIVAMATHCWAKASPEVIADLTIHYTYMIVLDDSKDDPETTMKTWCEDLLAGRPQKHPWWQLVNSQLPTLLSHYGPYCALNIVRSTTDFFQGCWIEQYNFQGFPQLSDYPLFLRRLNGLGHCVVASLFPKNQVDEKALFIEITAAISHIENWMVFVNDLLSFYKEFDESRDQTCLVNNYAVCDESTLEEALDKLMRETIDSSRKAIVVFQDKDPRLFDILKSFMHGYITWHLSDPRYRLSELQTGQTADGAKMRAYLDAGLRVGRVDPSKWAYPSVAELVKE